MPRILLSLFALFIVFAMPVGDAVGADYQKGLDAYNSGNYTTALREWKPIAEQGNALAQSNLGVMYERGEGVVQDYKEAVKWYRKSAEQGDAPAQYSFGQMYEQGLGVLQDYVLAYMWFHISASQESHVKPFVENDRIIVGKKMSPADISKAKNLARECVKKKYKGC